jgi:hypothetical protein
MAGILAADISGEIPTPFWHGLLYHGLCNTVAGPSGVGKTQVVSRIVADVTRTGGMVSYSPEEAPVIIAYRLKAAGADMSKVLVDDYILPRDLARLESDILVHGLTLVVFDTAEKHLDVPMGQWGKKIFKPLEAICYRTGCAMLFIHHTVKNLKKSASWQAALGGHTAGIAGSSRSVILVGKRPDNAEQLLAAQCKNAYGPESDAVAFEFDQETFQQPNGDPVDMSFVHLAEKGIKFTNPVSLCIIQGDAEKKGPSPEMLAAAAEFLTLTLADGPVPVEDSNLCPDHGHIHMDVGTCNVKGCTRDLRTVLGLKSMAQDADISHGTLKRARAALEIVASRKGAGKGAVPYVRLPDGHPAINPNAPVTLS